MKLVLLAASLLASTAAIAASPYDEPYSIITVDTLKSADPLLRRVIVNRVDDVSITTDNRAVVPPGMHKVTLDLPARVGFHQATQYDMPLETKPCTRYYVAAKLDSPALQSWTPIVRSEEPIGECMRKFQIAKAK